MFVFLLFTDPAPTGIYPLSLHAALPIFQVTVPPDSLPPPSADTNEIPAGTGSVNVTPVAPDGPLIVTTIVYTTSFPAETGSGESVFVTERSATGVTSVSSESLLFPPEES